MRRSGNIFEGMQSQDMASGLLQALQDAGTIRQEVNIPAVTYIMDNLANSMVNSSKTGSAPPYDELLETIAEMLDRMLTPEGGGDIEAGKNVLRQLAEGAKRFFDQLDTPTTVRRQP